MTDRTHIIPLASSPLASLSAVSKGGKETPVRSASLDAHRWTSTAALLNMMRQDTDGGLVG
ncbi:MAG: hypothetical protein K8J08_01760 [Thermoanaerobaculia bacterium]|nr:hypothetical protein [Thermoanaerobaculia bacterium]